jgi:RNA polymerase sigma-70 factor (ECF subfamily)
MSEAPLAKIFLDVLVERAPGSPATAEAGALEARLRELYAVARAAWPGFSVEAAEFVRAVAARLDLKAGAGEALVTVRATDLYLASACARGDPGALRAFEEQLLSQVPRFLAQLAAPRSLCDEVAQELRAELLVRSEGKPPRIAEYSGRGDLAGWLRVVAIRTALRLRKEQKKLAGSDPEGADRPLFGAADPELDYLKLRYRSHYELAFQGALSKLSKRGRLYLRLHHVDGLSIDELGRLYRVHRSTIARRLAAHRQKLYETTRDLLRVRLRVSDSEFESLLALVRSQLGVSIREALAKR